MMTSSDLWGERAVLINGQSSRVTLRAAKESVVVNVASMPVSEGWVPQSLMRLLKAH